MFQVLKKVKGQSGQSLEILFLAALLFSTPAWSKSPKETQKPKPQTTTGLEGLKFIEGDEKSNEERALKTEMMITRTEQKAIEQLQGLIKKYRGTPLEADLNFRLAELYMRRAKTARFFEINRDSETVVKLAPKVVANASSRKQIQLAIDTYEDIQRKSPKFLMLDMVIFNNAFARQQLGQEKEAERRYWQVIRSFPQSSVVPDSHLAIGEINFDRGNFSMALEHFNAIGKFPESRVYPYGLYKAAWAHYNLRDAISGLKKLEEVVAYGKYVAEQKVESRLDLRKEALLDMTVFYEDVLPAKSAYSYFKKQAGELEFGSILLKLAHIYERHSRYDDRLVVLSDYVDHHPLDPMVAEIFTELVWNYDSMKKKELAVSQMEKLYGLCRADSDWMKAQNKGKLESESARPDCMNRLNDVAVKLASRWLKIWKKNPAFVEFADVAEKSYAIYLREPGQSQEVDEARYAYAELLFQRQKFREASSQYALVSQSPQAKTLHHDAAYAAVVSLEKAVGQKWSDPDEKQFQVLAKRYIEEFPKGQYRLDLEFKTALIAYDKSRYDEAAPVFVRLGKDYGHEEKGRKSQDLYLDILNIKKDYKNLKDYAKSLMTVETEPVRKEKLRKMHEQSYFLQVQTSEESQNLEVAIQGYKEFASQNPKSELAEKALWNALQLHFKIFDFIGGAHAAEDFYEKFPNSPQAINTLLKAAESYESIAQLEPAADVLVKLAKLEPKNAQKWSILATDFYILANRPAKAKKLLQEQRSNSDAKVRVAAIEKMMLLEKSNSSDAQSNLWKVLADSGVEPQASMARAEIIEQLMSAGKAEEAFNEAKKVMGQSNASPSAKARARLVQARVLEDEFLRQSVKAKAEKIATVLAIKTEKLDKVQQALQQAIKFGDPKVTVESLRRLAGCYLHYVNALKTMPRPDGLSEQDEGVFRDEISKLVIPLEEKTIDTLQEGLRVGQKWRVRPDLVAEMKADMKKLNMPLPNDDRPTLAAPNLVMPVVAGVGP